MGELWDLEKLAEKCKAEGRYTFFLTSAPDNVSGKLNQPWRLEKKDGTWLTAAFQEVLEVVPMLWPSSDQLQAASWCGLVDNILVLDSIY